MIQPKCHTETWIREQKEHLKAADPIILEKAIFALTLLEKLTPTDLDFVFKGGTALLLHIETPRRLSIDIDITCQQPQHEIESILDSVLSDSPFTRREEHIRGERGLPGRKHYKFHYLSPTQNQLELHILLDVVTEKNHLVHIEEKPILTQFLEVTTPQSVRIPRVEALLGDKLTAFAPHTIGVPLTKQFSQQVIKQLFDIGQLYNHAKDVTVLVEDNFNSFNAEASYSSEFNGRYQDYLHDVIDTAYRICAIDLKGAPKDKPVEEALIRTGINQLSNHLIGDRFSLPQAKIAAAKAACLAKILLSESKPTSLPQFDRNAMDSLKDANISAAEHSILNRLKASTPEAFYYWL